MKTIKYYTYLCCVRGNSPTFNLKLEKMKITKEQVAKIIIDMIESTDDQDNLLDVIIDKAKRSVQFIPTDEINDIYKIVLNHFDFEIYYHDGESHLI